MKHELLHVGDRVRIVSPMAEDALREREGEVVRMDTGYRALCWLRMDGEPGEVGFPCASLERCA